MFVFQGSNNLSPPAATMKANASAPNLLSGLDLGDGGGGGGALNDLLGLHSSGATAGVAPSGHHAGLTAEPAGAHSGAVGDSTKSKNDILALYGSSASLGGATSQPAANPQHSHFGHAPGFLPSGGGTAAALVSPMGGPPPFPPGGGGNAFGSFQTAYHHAPNAHQQQFGMVNQQHQFGMVNLPHQQQQYPQQQQFGMVNQTMPLQQQLAGLSLTQGTVASNFFMNNGSVQTGSSSLSTDLWQ